MTLTLQRRGCIADIGTDAPPLFGYDTFQAANGTALTAHTPEVGSGWSQHPSSAVDPTITDNWLDPTSSSTFLVLLDDQPASADYAVSCVQQVKSLAGGNAIGLVVRCDATAASFYMARVLQSSGTFTAQLYRFDDGTPTLLDSAAVPAWTTSAQNSLECEVSGSATVTLTLRQNGVTIVSTTDSSASRITSAGYAGLRGLQNWRVRQLSAFTTADLPSISSMSKVITSGAILPSGDIVVATASTIDKSTDGGSTWATKASFTNADEARLLHRTSNGYLYASFLDRTGTSMASTDEGLWRSTDDGETWNRVLALGADLCVWGFAENSVGDLFAAVYQLTGADTDTIYKSIDDGATWTSVFDQSFRHVHDVESDTATDYLYACLGDAGTGLQTFRSTDDGSTWGTIFTGAPQYTCSLAIPGVCRLFGTDESPMGRIDRSTDDASRTIVLNGHYMNIFAMRRNPQTGHIYAIGKTDSSATHSLWAAIYRSADNGQSWLPVEIRSTSYAAGDGFWFASEFVDNQMIVGHTAGGGTWQNALVLTDS